MDQVKMRERLDNTRDVASFKAWMQRHVGPEVVGKLSYVALDFFRNAFARVDQRWSAERLLRHPWLQVSRLLKCNNATVNPDLYKY
jgi:hypothetical protein